MATISVRMDDQLKSDMEKVLSELGMNTTAAITMFAKAIVREKRLPLRLELKTWDEYTPEEIAEKLRRSDEDVKAGRVKSFDEVEREIVEKYGR